MSKRQALANVGWLWANDTRLHELGYKQTRYIKYICFVVVIYNIYILVTTLFSTLNKLCHTVYERKLFDEHNRNIFVHIDCPWMIKIAFVRIVSILEIKLF